MKNKEEIVSVKPVPVKLSRWKRLTRHLPFHCGYCGKRYVNCHSGKVNTLMPLPQNGRCCPDGHEGYIKEFIGVAYVYHYFDNTQDHD